MQTARIIKTGVECAKCNEQLILVCPRLPLAGLVAIAVKTQHILDHLTENRFIPLCNDCIIKLGESQPQPTKNGVFNGL